MKCLVCGAELPAGSKFCGNCGTMAEGVPAVEEAPKPQGVQVPAQAVENKEEKAEPKPAAPVVPATQPVEQVAQAVQPTPAAQAVQPTPVAQPVQPAPAAQTMTYSQPVAQPVQPQYTNQNGMGYGNTMNNMNNMNNYNGAPMNITEDNLPAEFKPISMWGYFGYELLFMIPCVGFIILLVLAFGASNRNVKNFARSYFCVFIILLIICTIVFALTGSALFVGGMN